MEKIGKVICLALVMLFATCGFLYARIGETTEQCTARYGEPLKKADNGIWLFKKADMFVIVHFYNDKADMISFRKIEENVLKIPSELSETEIQVLLNANSTGQEWKKKDVISMYSQWQTANADVQAQYQDGILMIATADYMKRDSDAKKAKEEEKLKEF